MRGCCPTPTTPFGRAPTPVIQTPGRLDNLGASNIVVAVIDNGFDTTHPDLKDKIFKPFYLWDQFTQLVQGDLRYSHGTPCAAIAVAASNGQGIVGVAPNAKFMPLSGTSYSVRATEQMFTIASQTAPILSVAVGAPDARICIEFR